jgi:hypothetical protein
MSVSVARLDIADIFVYAKGILAIDIDFDAADCDEIPRFAKCPMHCKINHAISRF